MINPEGFIFFAAKTYIRGKNLWRGIYERLETVDLFGFDTLVLGWQLLENKGTGSRSTADSRRLGGGKSVRHNPGAPTIICPVSSFDGCGFRAYFV